MALSLYKPFESLSFSGDRCFFSGKQSGDIIQIPVFPEWLMSRYELHEKTISMLAENNMKYSEIVVPCSREVFVNAITPLDDEIQAAFEAGYDRVREVPQIRLFQWMARIMTGMLYHDVLYGIRYQQLKGKEFTLSALLTRKFTNLHLMMQSVFIPMEFKRFCPSSIEVVPVNYPMDIFNYKDEPKNLNFSLGMNDFGIVACLQDAGQNAILHREILEKIGNARLHPIQFEELCARFIYSNYLLKPKFDFTFNQSAGVVEVELHSVDIGDPNRSYHPWDDKTFSQVLANYWKPWGFTSKDIYTFPDSPVSYLVDDYTNEFIDPEGIRV